MHVTRFRGEWSPNEVALTPESTPVQAERARGRERLNTLGSVARLIIPETPPQAIGNHETCCFGVEKNFSASPVPGSRTSASPQCISRRGRSIEVSENMLGMTFANAISIGSEDEIEDSDDDFMDMMDEVEMEMKREKDI